MERHRCKLCWRRFGSGRALGGHMRSHVMNPSMYTKRDAPESDTDSGNWEEEMEMMEMEEEVDEGLVWGQEGSMIESMSVHDRESESESSRRVLTGRRSKRFRPASIMLPGFGCTKKSLVQCEAKRSESGAELEQGSSISDSTVEDVAFCLMMLSRDKWNTPRDEHEHEHEHEEEEEVRVEQEVDSEDDSTKPSKKRKLNSVESKVVSEDKYKCETCSKTFTSYQALGGHKASHNKVKTAPNPFLEPKNPTRPHEQRIHQCPICLRVFPSGQALGGHKRSHANNAIPDRVPLRFRDIVIDLNFPAPVDEDNIEVL